MSDATVPMVGELGEIVFRDPFDVVYHREFRSMVRMATALVDSPEQAEEVVQDAFAALYLRYRLVNDPVSYARVSVLNGCRKVLRQRRIMRRRVGGVVGATAMLGVSGVAVLASRGSSETGIAVDEATTTWAMTEAGPMCGYTEVVPTTMVVIFEDVSSTITWMDTTVPWEATSTTEFGSPGCVPSGQFRCMGNNGTDDQGYTYFEYCEPVSAEVNYATSTMPDSTVGVLEGPSTFVPQTITTLPPTTTATVFDPATTPAMATTTT